MDTIGNRTSVSFEFRLHRISVRDRRMKISARIEHSKLEFLSKKHSTVLIMFIIIITGATKISRQSVDALW